LVVILKNAASGSITTRTAEEDMVLHVARNGTSSSEKKDTFVIRKGVQVIVDMIGLSAQYLL
jgi:hypothetical protein